VKQKIKQLKIKALKKISDLFGASSFFIQGRMDIDPKSLWFDPDFNNHTGGFTIHNDSINRREVNLPLHDSVRRDMLTLLCRSVAERNISGAIAELGVFQGQTARLLHYYFPERKLLLFDTFQGFDKRDVEAELETTGLKTTEEHFSNTAVDSVRKLIQPLNDNIQFIPGYFPSSIQDAEIPSEFAFVHIDVDLYQPTLAGLSYFFPKLSHGGIIVIHDYNAWPGVRKAVEEYCLTQSLIPIPMPDKSGSCMILKT